MKACLFFLGSAIRWMGSAPSRFLYFHLYLLCVYFFTYFAKLGSLEVYRLIFTLGILSPFLFAIYRGLPLDCLNFESALKKEFPEA
ncbi:MULTISPECIES: hypothetical protein [Prochlorococcus]|uniref:hypothetical protein n=1 Tax=Prochlorococcus TaxID=1218 RepID=UPI0002DD2E2F|nr:MULTISPECIES: hypothetical protein [Prochlorococcus]KGG21609.1 hypothetical protein EV08_0698 [Prochlorococcus marinus str. SS2]KGG23049.1 hypothetical protein EV09_1794 [Prochlorococcus marinus str. SS35]KGG33756.1 hypothetical protein EV10_0193 [Prochlorococcus marinus str. SS51]KGG36893.1 hypothetical protein EV11_0677 [Prochlorococcus sp. SS52]